VAINEGFRYLDGALIVVSGDDFKGFEVAIVADHVGSVIHLIELDWSREHLARGTMEMGLAAVQRQ
jgi:hypothetical protein